ncbi:hypothetical protein PFNF135_00157 [Plasmodium falciparum NF135/5.C10]|uniref:Duffy-binding-like domain-containing protein n=1 Tax=Plasmodium falciparum NF135/5.C10 TaxID=1036726 RepID=W4IQ27_PLAFA|nr:hypothetical protein PFNF135_00157 [Plasmodium falciparum NF135/5.C10]
MAPSGSAGGVGEIDDKDAKHLLDSIGKIVHDEVKTEAAGRGGSELKGLLSQASILGETGATENPCELIKDKRDELLGARGDPCENLSRKLEPRFSDTLGGQCTDSKIKGNKYNRKTRKDCGACAPYRRLHLCHHNLESISDYDSNARHKLLAEVCHAAKFEAESLIPYHAQYHADNPDFHTNICTELARSFADIGDIVRGKDLFRGNDEEKKQRKKLEKNLKTIFGKIHKEVTSSGSNVKTLKDRYKKDKDPNFFQLREDWWTANRHTVWEAITCNAKGYQYFRATCGGDEKTGTQARNQCRCPNGNDQVPTYFDYVPQYLRWFEEWAEDFCRLRKRKLEDAKSKCRRVENGQHKYCDLNGYDCEKTASGEKKFVEDFDCKDCQYSCAHFVKWIDNQKLEFLKQREKYTSEITGGDGRKKRGAGSSGDSSNYDGYENKFYDKLKKNNYGTVDDFLELLNKEKDCENIKDTEGGQINFKNVKRSSASGDDNNKTFSRTTYCEACPWCGAEKVNGQNGKWKAKDDRDCNPVMDYTKYENTQIPILTGDTTKSDMVQKYKKFCDSVNGKNGAPVAAPDTPPAASGEKGKNGDNITETWTCYYDENKENMYVNGAINFCVLQDDKVGTSQEKSMHYNAFFWKWVYHMLHDSLDWRKELGSCINNNTNGNTCKNKHCKGNCDCFAKWVVKKKDEWGKIKEHFKKQNIGTLTGCDPGVTLELLLEKHLLLESIQDVHADAKDIERIGKMLEQAGVGGVGTGAMCTEVANGKHNTKIDKFLEKELQEAQECQQNQEQCKKAEDKDLARSNTVPSSPDGHSDDDDEDDEEEEEEEDGGNDGHQEALPTQEDPKVCETVDKALTDQSNLTQACQQKYVNGHEKFPNWKCIPSGEKSGKDGAICVPPRRRRLYVTPLTRLAGGDGNTQSSQSQASDVSQGKDAASTSTSQTSLLRDAFIQSAAIETFFLWHKYKADKQKEKKQQQADGLLATINGDSVDGDENNPQKKLQESGTIPPDFLRLMFYTLGDYRDICIGGDRDIVGDTIVSNTEGESTKKISEKIKEILSKPNGIRVPEKSGQTTTKPEDWWNDTLGPAVWNGMICALTYKDNSETEEKKNDDTNNKPIQDTTLKDQLLESDGKQPKKNGKYNYNTVKLDENSGTEAKTTGGDTPLTDFISRPPYFRYLEEWGQHFCKERKKRLEDVKHNCRDRDNPGHHYCSGDGHDCTDPELKHKNMSADPDCPSCYEHCRKYRKWIDIKFEEFQKQKDKYGNELDKLTKDKSGGGDNKKFCEELQNRSTVDKFLKALKHCKDDQGGEEKDNDNKIDFGKPLETFRHSKYCETCPLKGVTCGGRNGCTPVKGNENTWKEVFDGINNENGKITENMNVQMIDRTGPFIDKNSEKSKDSNDLFKTSRLFKAIREQKWTCKFKDKNTDICKLDKFEKNIDLNQYTTFKVFLLYWLEDFLYGYYLLKKRKIIEKCTKNGEKACDKEPKNYCACVKEWVDQKTTEWDQIKNHFNRRPHDNGNDIKSKVKMFLETLIPRMDLTNGKEKIQELNKFLRSYECNCAENSPNGKESTPKDIVECLLQKLEDKAKKCQEHQTSVEPCPQTTSENPDDEDEQLEEETEVKMPKICEDVVDTKKENDVEVGVCEPASPDEEKQREKEKEEQEEREPSEGTEELPSAPGPPPPAPAAPPLTPAAPASPPPPPPPPVQPPPAREPFDPTILQTTIPFGWNQLKKDFISQYLQSEQPNDVPNDYTSGDIPLNTQPNTLYFDKPDEKPFITSIHDRDLYSGEEISYNVNMSTNSMDDIPINRDNNHVYSGIDLINDALNGDYDIYDELLKRKENELFGTNHVKQTSIHSVAKPISDDPIHNQLELFHKWLDRHRDMCEKWNNKEEVLDKLKEEWENETHSGNTHPSDNTPPTSDIPSDNNIPSSNQILNTDVSIQIHMDNPKPINEFTNMDTILEDLDKYNEPYYDVQDDIYYDVHDHDTSTVDTNAMDVPSKVQIEMDVNTKLVKEKYPISDVWDI